MTGLTLSTLHQSGGKEVLVASHMSSENSVVNV